MRVIRGVQEDSATLKLPNDGAGPYRRTTHLIVEMVATGLTKQKQKKSIRHLTCIALFISGDGQEQQYVECLLVIKYILKF